MSKSRGVAVVIALAYVGAALAVGEAEEILAVLGLMAASLACIWFGDGIGAYTGWVELRRITTPTPGVLIRGFGWVLLLLPAAALLITRVAALAR